MGRMVAEPLSISALATLTGRDRRTISGRLKNVKPVRKEGKSQLYSPPEALPVIYFGGEEGSLDLTHETARHKKAQADKTELEVSVMRGELIPAEDVAGAWAEMVSAIRAKLLTMPSAICAVLVGLGMRDIEREIKDYLYNSLEELSGSTGKRASVGRSASKDACDAGPAARPNG